MSDKIKDCSFLFFIRDKGQPRLHLVAHSYSKHGFISCHKRNTLFLMSVLFLNIFHKILIGGGGGGGADGQ